MTREIPTPTQDGPLEIIANLRVDTLFNGQDSVAVVRQLTSDEKESIGLGYAIAINPELTEGIVGYGRARCRKVDHYQIELGLEIAAARALADFAQKCEEAATAAVRTENEFQTSAALDEISSHVGGMLGPLRRLAEMAAAR